VKSVKARREGSLINDIVETLKSVPKRRLRIIRDVVGALAEPAISNKGKTTSKHTTRKSLLKTPFCGMWKRQADIANGQSHARTLRRRLETRGDRV
jgi:hypothetical protein